MNKTVAEFFAGIGLMRMGLEKADWNTLWANDIDADKAKMYRGHFHHDSTEFVLGDVHNIKGTDLPPITLATASFPCTDLSLAGARRGLAGEHSGAFWGFINAIKGMSRGRRPALVLLENVVGFLTSHDGADFRDACLALNELGYEVDALIIDAVHFVPQSRQRLFVVGSLHPQSAKVRETPKFLEGPCRPAALSDFIMWHPEIRWRIRTLPPLPEKKHNIQEIIEDIPHNSSLWWNRDRAEYLLSQMSERHRKAAECMIAGENLSYGTVFRRVRNGRSMAELRTDGIAGCLRTPRGGSGRQILFAGGGNQFAVRLLTPRECARLMGAGDYVISPNVTLNQALFGFGDAVCVSVIEWIGKNYLTPVFHEFFADRKVPASPTRTAAVSYKKPSLLFKAN